VFGLIQGGIVFVMSWGLQVAPRHCWLPRSKRQTAHATRRLKCCATLVSGYVCDVCPRRRRRSHMAASMAPIAKDFKIEKEPVELFGLMMRRWCLPCRSTASSMVWAVLLRLALG